MNETTEMAAHGEQENNANGGKGKRKKNPFNFEHLADIITAGGGAIVGITDSIWQNSSGTRVPTSNNNNQNNNNQNNNQQPQQGGGFYPYPNFQQPNFNLNGNDNRNGGQQPPASQKDNTMLIVGGFLGLLIILGIVVVLMKKK